MGRVNDAADTHYESDEEMLADFQARMKPAAEQANSPADPKSWSEEACPWHKGYADERGCTCAPEVIARREARSGTSFGPGSGENKPTIPRDL